MFGWIIPAPMAIPRSRTMPVLRGRSTCRSLGRVSVVMIALATSWNPVGPSFTDRTALAIRSTGRGTPMTPVLATATS